LSRGASVVTATQAVNEIGSKKSALQKKYTCFKAGVITDNAKCIFNHDGVNKKVYGKCPDDEGRSMALSPNKVGNFDYADLLGKLVTFGGTTAEKSVRSIVGGLIRGVAIAALENEVIAEVVAALAGGLAKKFVEYVTFKGISTYIEDDTNGIDAQTKQNSLHILGTFLGLVPE
jgi:hypothetical protein